MRLSIAARLFLGFGTIVLLSLVLSLYQLSTFNTAIRFLDAVTEYDYAAYRQMMAIVHERPTLRAMREAAVTSLALRQGRPATPQEYQAATARLMERMTAFAELARSRAADGISEKRRSAWTEIAEQADQMVMLERAIATHGMREMEAAHRGDLPGAVDALRSTETMHDALNDAEMRTFQMIGRLSDLGRAEVESAYRQALRASVLAISVVVLIGTLGAWFIGGSISRPLAHFVAFVQQVGMGELGRSLPETGAVELARLGAHLNGMTASLRDVAVQTRAAAENIDAATSEIRASAQQQAAAVAEQLSAIEETSATLTEITHSGAQIANRSREVEANSQGVMVASEQGLKAVEATVAAMDSIREQVQSVASTIVTLSERTQAIGEVILTVNTMAERSHLLALNAAIEAAAAGEHGRTFAVVAGEIKRLADQAREATQRVRGILGEIQQGINSSVMLTEEAGKRVEAGRRQTESTDHTIRSMADNIRESVQTFQQIVAATNQHQIGLEQVMQALTSIRQASSQTAATTRELEDAAGNLGELSGGLLDATRKYRL